LFLTETFDTYIQQKLVKIKAWVRVKIKARVRVKLMAKVRVKLMAKVGQG
jgi:hypothetical protein